jgi:hypothetical protein
MKQDRSQSVAGKFAERVKRWFQRPRPELPEDPYAMVTAPKKPRLPGRSAAAVAEIPER